MNNLKELTLKVCEIARSTGDFIRKERETFSSDKIERKGHHDYVSYVDKTAENQVVEQLKKLCPEAGFITEEGTVQQSDAACHWIIDPLDGTTNFLQDNAPYCVSIALWQEDDLLIGVVYEICRDECFYAWKEGGAYLNGKQLRVSDKPLENALIGLDLPYQAEAYKPVLAKLFEELYGKVLSIRINGSAAMGLCYVAVGRYDGWAEAYIKSWDYAAGALIVREAGGIVTDFKGNAGLAGTHHILATNGVIHADLQSIIQDFV